ncbi:hypothetical protein DPEC_G00244360 [Dallia pectoralis]|uniref:Uncharacterized protein n=1 Tax=Dallia pectoralis TaxID=75939 RepID=A0ACC2FVU6_DALPE|nr:hypothetical protein DPEC_G00244360 [Dallia pectoralis]
MRSSRRLLVVLSPDYLTEKSVSLLECRLGLYLQFTSNTLIVTVLYRPLPRLPASCTEARQLRCSTTNITWRGRQSEPPASRFWKRLRLALPVRPLALGRRLIDSTSSHLDLAASLGLLRQQRNSAESQRQRQTERKATTGSRGKWRQWRIQRIQEARSRGHMPICKDAGHGRYSVSVREPHEAMGRATEHIVKTQLHHQPVGDSNRPQTQLALRPTSTETQHRLHPENQPGTHLDDTETQQGLHPPSTEPQVKLHPSTTETQPELHQNK